MVCVDTFSSVHMALFALAGGRAELPPPTHHPTVKHTQICSDGSERSGLSDDCVRFWPKGGLERRHVQRLIFTLN